MKEYKYAVEKTIIKKKLKIGYCTTFIGGHLVKIFSGRFQVRYFKWNAPYINTFLGSTYKSKYIYNVSKNFAHFPQGILC